MLLGYHFRPDNHAGTSILGGVTAETLTLVFRAGFGLSWEPSRAAPVIIIGAGLVGPILAQALSARSIPYLIYEQDPHASHRGVGWGLTIQLGARNIQIPRPCLDHPGPTRRVCRSRGSEIRRERKFLVLRSTQGRCTLEGTT
jgi:hypothetical protein